MSEYNRTVVIVGGSAAGLRCACRVVRLEAATRVIVVEAREVFSYGACGLPYVLSGDIDNLQELRKTSYGVVRDADYFARYKGVDIRHGWRATGIDVDRQLLFGENGEGTQQLEWDELVLATGARARKIPGQPSHDRIRTFHGWDDVKPLKMGLMQGEIDHVGIIGGGLVGCELAEAFHSLWGAEVSLIEAAPSVLPGVVDPDVGRLVGRHMRESGVQVHTGAGVESIEADDEKVVLRTGSTTVECDTVVVAVGVEPNLDLARAANLEIGDSGGIKIDSTMATSVPHIWAAGDCVETVHRVTGEPISIPLGSLANRQGRSLANVLCGRSDRFGRVNGAMAVKAFDWNVAAVGCTTGQLKKRGIDFKTMWYTGEATPGYWPESKEIHILLHYETESLRLLGVQAVGASEVTKRIDVASQVISRGGTLIDLAEIEHAYAPPFSPAIDPLAVAAYAALNQDDGLVAVEPFADLDRYSVIDVRLDDEREALPLGCAGARDIEMGEVRARIGEIPEEPLVVVCARGTRSAEIARLLKQKGYDARYLGGGVSWRGPKPE